MGQCGGDGAGCPYCFYDRLFYVQADQCLSDGRGLCSEYGYKYSDVPAALVVLSSVLAACITAFAGPVSFVGIAVPHLVKNLFRTSKPILMIPACFLGGGVFCLFCDLIARTLFAPTELSISTVTAVFGAPVVILVMIYRQKEKM